jgi:hypothetical protein
MLLNACFYGQRLEFSKFCTLATQSLLSHVLDKCELRRKKLEVYEACLMLCRRVVLPTSLIRRN